MRLTTKQKCGSHLSAIVIVLVCTGASLLTGCDGFTHLKGVVLDSADKPLANADVTLIVGDRNQKVKTSESGVFVVGMSHSPWNPELSLSVAKAGYKTFERRFHPDEHLQTIVVTLQAALDTKDTSPHSVQIIAVEPSVKLEVLDWGGSGRSLVLLTGLPDTAHVFDDFAPKLTANYHVYGITRRGRGISSAPEPNVTNYSASRLGEDVLAVIDALHLNKPVIAGHSIAGEELSYIGSHHPDKVAGLIYIEAGYPYALYDQANGELELDSIELRNQLRQFINGYAMEPVKDYDTLIANLRRVEKEVEEQEREMGKLPPTPVSPRMTPDLFAIMEGRGSFTTIHAPALVLFADEDNPSPASADDPQSHAQAARQSLMKRKKGLQIAAFGRQVPSAHVVRIPHGTHYIFRSNEADVLREMNAFISALPQS